MRSTRYFVPTLLAAAFSGGQLLAATARAEGHGPVFGLATPTLGDGQWSSDTGVMQMRTDEGSRFMARETLGYGVTEDLQANLSVPLGRGGDRFMHAPRTRFGMMGTFGDLEASLFWRLHRVAPAVGTRYESTLILGAAVPTEEQRSGVEVGPSLNLALVTGYASRTWYWWIGGGTHPYLEANGDRLGRLDYFSAVVGYRPPLFRRDYPKPDWRVFVEALTERAEKNQVAGQDDPMSGGRKVFVGPSVLGLYGKWGASGGILFPVEQDLNGMQAEEKYRAKFVLTYWF